MELGPRQSVVDDADVEMDSRMPPEERQRVVEDRPAGVQDMEAQARMAGGRHWSQANTKMGSLAAAGVGVVDAVP